MTDTGRVSVRPVRGASGHIQGWAVVRNSREWGFYWSRVRALTEAHRIAAALAADLS